MSKIRDVLAKKGTEVVTVSPDATTLDGVDLMNERRIGALCVVDGRTLVGVFTERDLLNRVVGKRLNPASTRVADAMTSEVITCGLEGETDDCAAVMSHKRIRHLPVVEGGKLVGMISAGDLMALKVAEKQAFIEDLYQYLHGRR